jgi:hypothetical protein
VSLKIKNNIYYKIYTMSEQQQPQTITLNAKNSVEILTQYVEVAQKSGAFLLPESDILKRCKDVLLRGAQDAEINVPTARNLFVQAINKGQSKGAYTLDDASILHKVCQYVSQNLSELVEAAPAAASEPISDDLSSLSEPVPLRSGPKTV